MNRRLYRIQGLRDPERVDLVRQSLLARAGVARATFRPAPGGWELTVETRQGMAWVPGLEAVVQTAGGQVVDQQPLP